MELILKKTRFYVEDYCWLFKILAGIAGIRARASKAAKRLVAAADANYRLKVLKNLF